MTLNHFHLTNIKGYLTSVSPFYFSILTLKKIYCCTFLNILSAYANCVPYKKALAYFIFIRYQLWKEYRHNSTDSITLIEKITNVISWYVTMKTYHRKALH